MSQWCVVFAISTVWILNFFTMGSGSYVMSVLTMVLLHVVLAESNGVKAEDKNGDTVFDALLQFILHPDNQHFADMRNYFTLSRLSTFVTVLLGRAKFPFQDTCWALHARKGETKRFCGKAMEIPHRAWSSNDQQRALRIYPAKVPNQQNCKCSLSHHSVDFHSRDTLNDRAALGFWRSCHRCLATVSEGILHDSLRNIFGCSRIDVRWSFGQEQGGTRHMFSCFISTIERRHRQGVGWKGQPHGPVAVAWWTVGLVHIWTGAGLWTCLWGAFFFLGVQRASDISALALETLLITKWSIALVCLCFCLTEANPEFWNLAGVFLGSMSFFGWCFFVMLFS